MPTTATLRLVAVAALAVAGAAAHAQTAIGPASSYPIRINTSGSYKLTGNITVPPNTTAIEVNADNVTIDLNGYTLTGSDRSCSQTQNAWGLNCTFAFTTSGDGISGSHDNLIVRNGRIQGFYDGVRFAAGGRAEKLSLRYNYFGMQQLAGVAQNSTAGLVVSDVTAEYNYGGILMVNGMVEGSMAKGNSTFGVSGTQWVSVTGSTIMRNTYGVYYGAVTASRVFDNSMNLAGATTY